MRRQVWRLAASAVVLGALSITACSKEEPAPTAIVIGDSLTVGAEIGGLGRDGTVRVEAREGRTTEAGIAVARGEDLSGYEQVIVALGTNDFADSEIEYAAKIDRMMDAIGPDIPVTWVNVDSGTAKLSPVVEGVNPALVAAAERHPNLTIGDWDGYLAGRGDADDLRAGDGVHDSAEGYRVRARWMQDLVGS
ncbi:MAG: acetyltransferase [Ilumatobacteraceae bacterium]|nr:acetyltransferase [Ilumatobacteraceae bacterium]